MATSVLFLGLLLGLQHAFEADHVAAVTGMNRIHSQGSGNFKHQLLKCTWNWSIGHGLVLIFGAILVYFLGLSLPASLDSMSEIGVGCVLCIMGIRLLYSRRKKKPERRIDPAIYPTGPVPKATTPSMGSITEGSSANGRSDGTFAKSLLLGILHGLAGSGALFILLATTTVTPIHAVTYVSIFSIGTLGGMTMISLLIAWPASKFATFSDLQSAQIKKGLGLLIVLVGISVLYDNIPIIA